jgi:formate hydrogenlyase subunit 3/multisubunit Na+/H+ antiporter MnhD subunit
MALIPILLLILGAGALWMLRGQKNRVLWSWTMGMTLLVWGTVMGLRLALPETTRLSVWQPEALFASSLELQLDAISWGFVWSGITLLLAIVLASPTWTGGVAESTHPFSLVYAAMTLSAMLAGNILTIVMLWTLIDLGMVFFVLRIGKGEQRLSSITMSLTFDAVSILFLLGAALVAGAQEPTTTFEMDVQSALAATLLCFGVLLRLGLLPMHLSLPKVRGVGSGAGALVRFLPSAMALLVLARLLQSGAPDVVVPWLRIAGSLGAILGGLRWTLEQDSFSRRSFFILALSGVGVLAASLSEEGGDSTIAATAALLVMVGGVISLAEFYSPVHRVWYILGGALLLGLPWTPGYPIASAIAQGFVAGESIVSAVIASLGVALLAAGTFRRAFAAYSPWPTGENLGRLA